MAAASPGCAPLALCSLCRNCTTKGTSAMPNFASSARVIDCCARSSIACSAARGCSRRGQPMRLHPLAALQAMLDRAQQSITLAELAKFGIADVPFVVQFLQSEQSASGAQPGLAAAMNALQTLHQKFDLADAAHTALHI